MTFSLGCLPAASQQASTRHLPKPLNMAICPKPLINGRRQTSSFAFLPLTAPYWILLLFWDNGKLDYIAYVADLTLP